MEVRVKPRFDWNDIQFFLAVARTGTLSGASRQVGFNHATVSRRVATLEGSLEVKLFERNLRGYNLTQTGMRFLSAAESIESAVLKAERKVAGDQQRVSGTVRISTLEGFGNFFLTPRLSGFLRDNPDLLVELVSIQQIVALSRREADIAVTLKRPSLERYLVEKLSDYSLYVYGAPEFLAAAQRLRCAEDLLEQPFVGYIDDLIFVRDLNYLGEIVPGLKARFQCSSIHAQVKALELGFGLGVLPAFIGDERSHLVRVLPDRIRLVRTYWMLSDPDVAESSRVRAVRRFIREEVAENTSTLLR